MFVPKSIVCLRDYSWKQFQGDLVAGLVVGLVALPLAMAFSIACNLPPERGLYTAVVAGFFILALSGSRGFIGGAPGGLFFFLGGAFCPVLFFGGGASTRRGGGGLLPFCPGPAGA